MIDKIIKILERITPNTWHGALNNEGYKRYFTSMGWMFGGQMFSLLASFFVGAWIARYLGPESYGVLSYSIAFVGIFGVIATLGIEGVLNRELVKNPEKRDELLGTAFRLKLIGGGIAFFLTFIFVMILGEDPLIKLLTILLSFAFILQSINIIRIFFQAEVKSKNTAMAVLGATVISSILKIIVIYFNMGIIAVVIVFILDSLWQGIGFLRAYRDYGLKVNNWKFDKVLAKDIMRNSWPLLLSSAAGFIYLKIDQVMIGSMLGSREVGIYAAAVKLVDIWYFIPAIICTSLFPAIINAKKTSLKMYKSRLKNFYILMAIIPIVMAIPIMLLAKPIILTIFGNSYLESVSILKIYIWSSFGLFLSFAVNQYLMSENKVMVIFWLNFIAMVLNIVLNLIFIPMYGIVGSAWATLISYLVIPVGVWLIRK
jgi:O-antigen/teichoic acid export membrane protein